MKFLPKFTSKALLWSEKAPLKIRLDIRLSGIPEKDCSMHLWDAIHLISGQQHRWEDVYFLLNDPCNIGEVNINTDLALTLKRFHFISRKPVNLTIQSSSPPGLPFPQLLELKLSQAGLRVVEDICSLASGLQELEVNATALYDRLGNSSIPGLPESITLKNLRRITLAAGSGPDSQQLIDRMLQRLNCPRLEDMALTGAGHNMLLTAKQFLLRTTVPLSRLEIGYSFMGDDGDEDIDSALLSILQMQLVSEISVFKLSCEADFEPFVPHATIMFLASVTRLPKMQELVFSFLDLPQSHVVHVVQQRYKLGGQFRRFKLCSCSEEGETFPEFPRLEFPKPELEYGSDNEYGASYGSDPDSDSDTQNFWKDIVPYVEEGLDFSCTFLDDEIVDPED